MRTYLRLQARVQLQSINVAIQLPRRLLQKYRPSSASVLLASHSCMHDPKTQQTKLTAISGSEFHSSKLPNLLSPKKALNSFIVHTPHPRACAIPSISTTRIARNTASAVACSIRTVRVIDRTTLHSDSTSTRRAGVSRARVAALCSAVAAHCISRARGASRRANICAATALTTRVISLRYNSLFPLFVMFLPRPS